MCTGSGVALGLQGLGLGMSAISSFGSSQSSKLSLQAQADVADINAGLAESSAQSALLSGQREEQKSRIATANLKGTQRATLAANGVDLGVGSAENILTTTDVLGEIDANTIQQNAIRSAWGYRTQGANYKAQARSSRSSSDAISPSLIGGIGQVASSWYQYNKVSGDTPMNPDPRSGIRGQKGY